MKTVIFQLLLGKLAKQLMPEAEYNMFRARMWMRRWQEFREDNPNLWEWFSEKYEVVKGALNPNSAPEEVVRAIVPGQITRYPEIFQPFMKDLTIPGSVFSGCTLDFSGVDLSGVDITGMDLSGMDISGMELPGIDVPEDFWGEIFEGIWEILTA